MRFIILALLLAQPVTAATFTGSAQATFRATEMLNGSTVNVEQLGPISFTLTTDYRQISWAISYDVDLLMAGGPDKPFETRFRAKGTLATVAPSSLTFPDASGTVGAGQYSLQGTGEWSLFERIVNVTDNHDSGMRSIAVGGGHSLSIADYPEFIRLNHGLPSFSTGGIMGLGRITIDGNNHFYNAQITGIQPSFLVTLTEALLGDFASNGSVDAADYVVWRDSPLPLGPFLSSYDSWRSNFGKTAGGGAASNNIPEPSSVLLVASVCWAGLCTRKRACFRH